MQSQSQAQANNQMNIFETATHRYSISSSAKPQPWISTIERSHHHLLLEILPIALPEKSWLLNNTDAHEYQWRFSLWQHDTRRISSDVYAPLQVASVIASGSSGIGAGSAGVGSLSPLKGAKGPRSSSKYSAKSAHATHSSSSGSSSHHHTHVQSVRDGSVHGVHSSDTGSMYILDLDAVESLLLPPYIDPAYLDDPYTSSVGEGEGGASGRASVVSGSGGGGKEGRVEYHKPAWSIGQTLNLVVEIVHVPSGLPVSRGSVSFKSSHSIASSDINAHSTSTSTGTGNNHNMNITSGSEDPAKFQINHCYSVNVDMALVGDRAIDAGNIVSSKTDSKQSLKNRLTDEELPLFSSVVSYVDSISKATHWEIDREIVRHIPPYAPIATEVLCWHDQHGSNSESDSDSDEYGTAESKAVAAAAPTVNSLDRPMRRGGGVVICTCC